MIHPPFLNRNPIDLGNRFRHGLLPLDRRCRVTGEGEQIQAMGRRWLGGNLPRIDLLPATEPEHSPKSSMQERILELRFDPSSGPGRTDLAWLRVQRHHLHPLEIESVSSTQQKVVARIRNHGATPRDVQLGRLRQTIPAGSVREFEQAAGGKTTFESVDIRVASPGLPTLRRQINRFHIDLPITNGSRRIETDALGIDFASDGSGGAMRLP